MKKRIMSTILLIVIIICMIPTNIAFASNKKGTWKHNTKGWWYSYSDNSYAKNEIIRINGKYYYFNKYGYMKTGWQKLYIEPYYIGNMEHQTYSSSDFYYWYYFHSDGSMAINEYINGYYLNHNGIYDNFNGQYAWKKYVYEDNHWEWRYVNLKSHKYITQQNWVKIDNKYYCFDESGNLYRNIYIGDNETGFYWVDKNGTWSYKAKLNQLDSGDYISDKYRMFGKYKDNKGFIPKGKYIFKDVGWYNDFKLVTFDNNGKVTASITIEYDSDNQYFYYSKFDSTQSYCIGIYKLNQNSSGKVISEQVITKY